MRIKQCPLCKEELFSELEKGCKMCGMPLNKGSGEFCSRKCENIFKMVHK